MRVLVCGDREWANVDWLVEQGHSRQAAQLIARKQRLKIRNRLYRLSLDTLIIHGAARGADAISGLEATTRGMGVVACPADWQKYGRSAGPIRNRQMLDTKPDLVIAFHADLARSKGTADCVREARRRGIPVEVIG